jgi:hypothetical protein
MAERIHTANLRGGIRCLSETSRGITALVCPGAADRVKDERLSRLAAGDEEKA